MKTRVLLGLLLIVLCLPAIGFGKDAWTRVSSKNFALVGNADEAQIRRVAQKLEQFRAAFRQLAPNTNFDSATPTVVIVFKDAESYTPFKPVRADGSIATNVTGYFQPGKDVNYITLSTAGDEQKTFGIVFHEYVHFIVNNNLGRANVPPWFNEGLGEYYQSFRLTDDQQQAILGQPLETHLQFLQRQELIPFDEFFNINYYTLHNQGNHGASMFYSEAWALMHFLQHGNQGARRPQLAQFLNLLLADKPVREAFETAFQTDYATMEKDLRRYVEQRQFTTATLALKDRLALAQIMQSAPLSEADANAYLGDLLLHNNRLKQAKSYLEQALMLDANSAFAHASLGMLFAQQREFERAKQHFERAVRLDSKNYLPYFYYAYALSCEEMDASGYVLEYLPVKAAKMTDLLDKAIALNPNFAESYQLRAFINLVNNIDLNQAIALLDKALALEPGNQSFQIDRAQVLFRKQEFDRARGEANRVFASAEDTDVRTRAQALVNNINRYEADLKRSRELEENPELAKPTPTPQLSVEELINQSLNEALRRPRAGEKRVVGYLTRIDCADQASVFSIRAEAAAANQTAQTYKLTAANLSKITLIAFTADANGRQIGCDLENIERFAVVTFRPHQNPNAQTDGEIVALEFMPKTFRMLP